MKRFNRVLALFLALLLIISNMSGTISALEEDNNSAADSTEEYSEDVSESISDTLEDNSEGLDSSANEYEDSALAQNSEEDPLDSNAASLDESVEEKNPQSDKVGIEEPENRSSKDTIDESESDVSGDSNELNLVENDLPEETIDNESDVIASGTMNSLSWTLDSEGVLTIAGNGSMPNYQYSSSPWTEYIESIKSVIITDGVTNIGSGAFKDCSNLISIEISDTVTSIKEGVFSNCSSLTSIVIPDGVTSIEGSSFSNCSSLTSIDIPESVTSIGYAQTFYGCSSLTSIVIPEGVTSIGLETFSGCSSLVNVVIPNTVTNIEGSAFNGCRSLESIEIPNSVTSIGYDAFSSCSSLTSIVIPEGVTSIGRSAFNSCSALASIDLPDGITSIEGYTFYNCRSLNSIVIPDGVTSIGDKAFYNCNNLTNINIPDSVTSIGSEAFRNCYTLTPSIAISDNVTSLGTRAFSNCSGLTSIVIPSNITSIGQTEFINCSNLISVEIPNTVTSIEKQAFSSCDSLSSINIPDSVTSIGESAFLDCSSLTSIVIPDSVTSIEKNVFYGCSTFTDIYYSGTEEQWEQIIIDGNNSELGNAAIHYLLDTGTCGDNITWTLYNDGLFVLSGSGAMTDYENRATPWYEYREQITKVVVSEGITTIGRAAFFSSANLSSVVISKGITRINENAFIMCHNLTSITLPVELTKIEDFAFNLCDSLTEVSYPGTYDDWSRITIGENNGPLEKAAIDYFTIGKTFSAPEYEWEYNSGNYFLTGRIACIEIPDIVITEYASVDSEIEKESTCTEEGIIKYIASFEDPRFETQERTETTPALGHDMEHFDALEATTQEDGNIEYWYCHTCEKYFSDENAIKEIDLSETVITYPWPVIELDTPILVQTENDQYTTYQFTAPEDGTYIFASSVSDDKYDPNFVLSKRPNLEWKLVESMEEGNFYEKYDLTAGQKVYLQIWVYDLEAEVGTGQATVTITKIPALEVNSPLLVELSYDRYTMLKFTAPETANYTLCIGKDDKYFDAHFVISEDDDPQNAFAQSDNVTIDFLMEGQTVYYGIMLDADKPINPDQKATVYISRVDNCPHPFGLRESPYLEPNCEDDGHLPFLYCPACTERFVIDKPTERITDWNDVTLEALGHSWGSWTVIKKATTSAAGQEQRICQNDPSHVETRSIPKLISIKKATVSGIKASYVYTAKEIKPTVKVVLSGKTLKNGTDYKVTYSKNKSVGTATVKITGIGKYADSISKTFKINPKGTTLATSTAASKAITVKWKKQSAKMASSRISGYQIQLATNSKFTKNKKTVTVSGYSKTSKKITKLKGKTKYYIRIRTYKTVGGVKYYSPWSKVKTITTKK